MNNKQFKSGNNCKPYWIEQNVSLTKWIKPVNCNTSWIIVK